MPLTDKQKAFLIFKKFTGLSDDSILRNHEKLHGKYTFQQKSNLLVN